MLMLGAMADGGGELTLVVVSPLLVTALSVLAMVQM
jgi:hypothetical protein